MLREKMTKSHNALLNYTHKTVQAPDPQTHSTAGDLSRVRSHACVFESARSNTPPLRGVRLLGLQPESM